MGVKNLWILLEDSGALVSKSHAKGKRLAIDASILVHQLSSAEKPFDLSAIVSGFVNRICVLFFHGIKPIFVFDGPPPLLKKPTSHVRNFRYQLREKGKIARLAKKVLLRGKLGQSKTKETMLPAGSMIGFEECESEDEGVDFPALSIDQRRVASSGGVISLKRDADVPNEAGMDPNIPLGQSGSFGHQNLDAIEARTSFLNGGSSLSNGVRAIKHSPRKSLEEGAGPPVNPEHVVHEGSQEPAEASKSSSSPLWVSEIAFPAKPNRNRDEMSKTAPEDGDSEVSEMNAPHSFRTTPKAVVARNVDVSAFSLENNDVFNVLKELLNLCGCPWLIAASEAEAQCAFLQRMGIVDGICTEDSDVFPFGGNYVYRGFFSKNSCIFYDTSQAGLNQHDFVFLSALLGCDYFEGIFGFGVKKSKRLLESLKSEFFQSNCLDFLGKFLQDCPSHAGYGDFLTNHLFPAFLSPLVLEFSPSYTLKMNAPSFNELSKFLLQAKMPIQIVEKSLANLKEFYSNFTS